MKKNALSAAIIFLAALFSLPTYASPIGFNGAYDYSTWTKSNTGPTGAQVSTIDGTQQTLTLYEPNDYGGAFGSACVSSPTGCSFDFSHVIVDSGVVSFNWAFNWGVDPCCSGFNVYVNSTLYNLADGYPGNKYNNSGGNASGVFSMAMNAGDILKFSAFSADACCGPATTVITNFNAPVPEPTTLAILGLGLAGLGFGQRRKQQIA